MLKLIFDKDVKLKKKLNRQRWRLTNSAFPSDFMFVNIEPYKSNKCVP